MHLFSSSFLVFLSSPDDDEAGEASAGAGAANDDDDGGETLLQMLAAQRVHSRRRKRMTPEQLEEYNAAQARKGILYFSSVPPFMKPAKVGRKNERGKKKEKLLNWKERMR